MADPLSATQAAMQHLERAHSILKDFLAQADPIALPNGHLKVELDDQMQVDIAPDGATVVRFSSGVEVEHSPNGSKCVRFPDGTVLETLPNGSRHIRNLASGTVLSEQPDGSQTLQTPGQTKSSPALQRLAATPPMSPSTSSDMLRAGSVDSLALLEDVDTTTDDEAEPEEGLETVDDKPERVVLHSGWLLKEGGSIKTWRKRFFKLTSDCLLSYYDKQPEAGGRFINAIDIIAAQATIATELRKPHGFYLYSERGTPRKGSATNKRSKYVLCANSDMDREVWVTNINNCHSEDLVSLDGSIRPIPTHSLASRMATFAKGVSATNKVRQLVSKQKRRYQQDGYDLDLTYITSRIVAMGYPAEGNESVYRNKYEDVHRLLEEKHHGHYRVYNLCSERAYPGNKFHNRVACYPFDDHNPAPLELVADCCADIHRWLDKHPDNCAVIHCKAGKGRTGVIIVCYLMYSEACSDADAAMTLFGTSRTYNGKGVTIPSQRRYIRYYQTILQNGGDIPPPQPIQLEALTIHTIPNYDLSGGCQPFLRIYQDGITRYSSKLPDGNVASYKRTHHQTILIPCHVKLQGDLRFEVWNTDRVFHQDEKMFSFTVYSGCLPEEGLRLARLEIDGAHKKKHLKIYEDAFAVQLSYSFV
eukprot:m.22441 g.22441  ORF g.22441 m.22441 type:complete len:645 (+) comp11253_c0_seq1:163-2097(+)